jgi:hypothetical protein
MIDKYLQEINILIYYTKIDVVMVKKLILLIKL